MYKRQVRGALATLPLLTLLAAASATTGAQDLNPPARAQSALFGHENTLRKRVVTSVMPAYPKAAVRAGIQGLAAALVTYDETGAVVRVEILKSPDGSIAEAVRDALRQWTFSPPTSGRPIRGTLRFSFTIEGGEGRVEYGPMPKCQKPGRTMPDGTLSMRLEDIDTPCGE